MAFEHVLAEVNHEEWDPKLDEEVVFWYKLSTCPIPGCKDFSRAKAWSMESEEKVIAYTKHHMMYSKLQDHFLNADECNQKLDEAFPHVEHIEWKLEDRKQYAHDQQKWAEGGGGKKRQRDEDEHVEDDDGPAPSKGHGKGGKHGKVNDDVVKQMLTQITQDLMQQGWTPPSAAHPPPSAAHPPIMFPPAGLPPGIPTGYGGRPALPPSVGLNPIQQPINIVSARQHPSASLLIESMVRAEEAMKAAMQQCLTNARNIHNELTVLQQVLAVLRSGA